MNSIRAQGSSPLQSMNNLLQAETPVLNKTSEFPVFYYSFSGVTY